MRRRDLLKVAPALMAPALARAEGRALRYIPNSGLSTIDPIWTTALIAGIHGYMVFDTLYGLDAMGQARPQMCAGHDVSADGLTWTFTCATG
jgi:peptide/nickel transport system substrate-binding protein